MVVRNQAKSSRKDGVAHKLVLQKKIPYRFLYKAKSISCWLQHLPFREGPGRTGRKLKYPAARMEKIPSTIVLHMHADGSDTIFYTI